MLLGLNSATLRTKRTWAARLWRCQHHWALVLQPAGEAFTARLTDDVVRGAETCFNIEVESKRLFLVYELLVDQGAPYLALSAKPDFDPGRGLVQWTGRLGPMNLMDIEAHSISVAKRYKGYSLLGCNCQHFVRDLAERVGAPLNVIPEDEATADVAMDGARAAGAVAGTAAILGSAMSVSFAGAAAGSTLSTVPVYLAAASVGAGACGAVTAVVFVTYACSYRHFYSSFRTEGDKES